MDAAANVRELCGELRQIVRLTVQLPTRDFLSPQNGEEYLYHIALFDLGVVRVILKWIQARVESTKILQLFVRRLVHKAESCKQLPILTIAVVSPLAANDIVSKQ